MVTSIPAGTIQLMDQFKCCPVTANLIRVLIWRDTYCFQVLEVLASSTSSTDAAMGKAIQIMDEDPYQFFRSISRSHVPDKN